MLKYIEYNNEQKVHLYPLFAAEKEKRKLKKQKNIEYNNEQKSNREKDII